jgi:hypothetical protein
LKLPHGPPLYKPPTRQALGGALLDANASTYEEDLSERIEADAVEECGAAIVTRRKQITPCSLAPRPMCDEVHEILGLPSPPQLTSI